MYFYINCQCTVVQRRRQCTWNSKVLADRFCLHFSFVMAKWADQLQLYSNCTRRRVSHWIVFTISQEAEEGASSGGCSSGLHAEQQHLRTGIWWETLQRFGFFSPFLAPKRNKIFRIPNTETIQFACGIEFEWMLNAKANANARRRRRDGILIEMWIEWNQAKSRSVTKCDKTKRKNIEINIYIKLHLVNLPSTRRAIALPSLKKKKKNNVIKQTKTATQTEK